MPVGGIMAAAAAAATATAAACDDVDVGGVGVVSGPDDIKQRMTY